MRRSGSEIEEASNDRYWLKPRNSLVNYDASQWIMVGSYLGCVFPLVLKPESCIQLCSLFEYDT